jgi:transposase
VPTVVDICSNHLIKAVCEVGVWLDYSDVPYYSCRHSKRVFTQHQLLQGLVVKTLYRLRYRELTELLQVSDTLVDSIGYRRIPHYTTFQKFAARFPCRILHQLIASVAKYLSEGTLNIALDSTGFSLTNASYHYIKRCDRKEFHKDFLKASLAVDTRTQCVAAVKIRCKRRHDLFDAKPTLRKARQIGIIETVVADRGYDSESLMQFIKEELKAEPVIRLKWGETPVERTRGETRKQLRQHFPTQTYHQRSLVETANSSIKRRFDSVVRAKKYHTQKLDTLLKVPTHNLTLNNTLEILKRFLQSQII